MKLMVGAFVPILMLAACGGDDAPAGNAATDPAAVPGAFPLGEWEATATVEKLTPADREAPATKAREGDKATRKACIAKPDDLAALFTSAGDECTVTTSYARTGRINTAYSCKRAGDKGLVNPTANGRYTADTLDVTVDTASYLAGMGDYVLKEKVVGKRLGNCAAAG
jgi:hypothetical protein